MPKKVSFNIGTGAAATTVDVTSPGFRVAAVVLIANGRTESSDAGGAADEHFCVGFAASASDRRYIARMSQNGQLTSNVMDGDGSDACLALIDTAGAYAGKADNFTPLFNGFRLTIDQQFSINLRVTAYCFEHPIEAETVIFTEPAAAGNLDVPAPFLFDHLILIGQASGAAQPSLNATGRICVGMCDAALNQAVWMGGSLDGQATSSTGGYCRMGEVLAHRTNSTTLSINSRGAITIRTATNFRVNFIEVVGTAARQYMCLLLKGIKSTVGSFVTENDTITPMVESGFGFAPEGVVLMSGAEPEDAADTPHVKDELSIGAFDEGGGDLCHAFRDDNGEAITEVSTRIDFNDFYLNLASLGVQDGAARKQSLDANGFAAIMSDADPTNQNFVAYSAFDPNVNPARNLVPFI